MELPALMYKCPGPHTGSNGTTFEALPAESEEQVKMLMEEGWCASMSEAIERFKSPPVVKAKKA